jgi:hypothetical protein
MDDFEVTADGESVVGPVSLDQVRRGLASGKIPPTAQIRRKGEDGWHPVLSSLTWDSAGNAEVPPATNVQDAKVEEVRAQEAKPVSPTLSEPERLQSRIVVAVMVLGACGVIAYIALRSPTLAPNVITFDPRPTSEKFEPLDPAVAKEEALNREASRMKELRSKVRRSFWSVESDGTCAGKGLPPYRWTYEGGTFGEDAEVARADGCRPLFEHQNTTFCCPKKPVTF